MKKTISITISGIIFHIEEDGYDKLKHYLDSIHKYFAGYDDSHEIISDIEGRIAEKFLAKLNAERQVVALEDVQELIAKMGSTADFEAAEAEAAEDLGAATPPPPRASRINLNKGQSYSEEKSDFQASKKLYRDEQRKLVGGVAAGVAHYFAIDPLWVRLLVLCFGLGLWFFPPITGFICVSYLVLWIVVPAGNLEENLKIRKLFRDGQNRVIGGVASGLSAYFNSDVTIIRLLLVLGLFVGGSTLLIYLVLWTITPEAKTITEKMEMQGEPVTLDNIEKSIKKNFNITDNQKEGPFIKLVLFPFRLIAAVVGGLSVTLKPILKFGLEAARIFIGGLMVFIAFVMMVAEVICLGALVGIINSSAVIVGDMPAVMLGQDLPVSLSIAGFVAAFIPTFLVGLSGLSLLTRRSFISAFIGWTALGLWFLAVMIMAAMITNYVRHFEYQGRYEKSEYLPTPTNTLHLDVRDAGAEHYRALNVELKPYDGDSLKLVSVFKAQGENRNIATENAHTISHTTTLQDSTLIFDDNITFNDHAPFRGQRADLTLYVPYNKPFRVTHEANRIISNVIDFNGDWDKLPEQQFMFTHEKGLICVTCKKGEFGDDNDDEQDEDDDSDDNGKVKAVKGHIEITGDSAESVQLDVNVDSTGLHAKVKPSKGNKRK
ncbi:Phage shock protein PspC (stress-responsive transcriptional regulator) [Flexibacter flexilis DSM 6793]|uniref:Phage shock protein PspC (Stress-responsive transcriptional regulator) n=1 Tax=Flexibacter flexilis DSM 6793 TaxID=927664 RepID=A0A1I1KFH9_9BACT|nr:PspC domain-containing protein [Flexibacter flexilis]SFC59022.1 Phage shock protein PspC (stress-responsive transcriptional regulator) [Flexibacter flexilis DSM 6793]